MVGRGPCNRRCVYKTKLVSDTVKGTRRHCAGSGAFFTIQRAQRANKVLLEVVVKWDVRNIQFSPCCPIVRTPAASARCYEVKR